MGDQMLIVCAEADQEAINAFIGPKLNIDFEQSDQPLVSKRILVTNADINGKSLASMHFSSVYGVNVTRVTRQGMDIFASSSLPLQVGDRIMVVGPEDAVDRVANNPPTRCTEHCHDFCRRHHWYHLWYATYRHSWYARTNEAWYCWWPANYCNSDRSLWLQDSSGNIHDNQRKYDVA